MATVTFWNNHAYGGDSDTYNGAQRRSYSTSKAWDSVKVGSDSWVVVWENSGYSGAYMKLGPNTDNSDFNKTDKSSGGDWKNQIKAFIMYGREPSWWNDSSAPPNNDLNLASNECVFTDETWFNGNCATFFGTTQKSDLNSVKFPTNTGVDLKNDIQSVATGASAWLEVWNDTDYSGDSLRIYPNTTYHDLDQVARIPKGDWKNQMQSFKLYNYLPDGSWALDFDEDKFFNAFPGAYAMQDSSGPYYHYVTQDCGYDVRITGKTFDSESMTISFRVDYDLTGHNDKVNLDLKVNLDGSMNSVTYEYEQGGAVQIPSAVIKAVDVGAEVLGAVGALETAGISEEAANSFIEAFDTFCEVFNKVSNGLYKLSEANDGRFYMCGVCTNLLARALSAVTVNS